MRENVTGSDQPSVPGVDVVQLDETTTAAAHVGDKVRVELRMNTGTGYEWKCVGCVNTPTSTGQSTTTPSVLTPHFDWSKGLGENTSTGAGIAGGPVICVFEFSAAEAGSCTLTFQLARPWETGVKPADTRALTVNVARQGGS